MRLASGRGKRGAFSELTGSMSRAAGKKINRIITFSKKKNALPGEAPLSSGSADNPRCGKGADWSQHCCLTVSLTVPQSLMIEKEIICWFLGMWWLWSKKLIFHGGSEPEKLLFLKLTVLSDSCPAATRSPEKLDTTVHDIQLEAMMQSPKLNRV